METWDGNPFGRGPGSMPPHLAGRDALLARLDVAVGHFERSVDGRRAFDWPVLIGPRGTGKTTLLQALQSRLTGRLPEAFVCYTTPAEYQDVTGLIGSIEAEFGIAPNQARLAGSRLAACCREKPVAILVDEAHTMEWSDAQRLLGVLQKASREAPLLSVFAGTPHLSAVFKAANASFEERADLLGVGDLDEAATRDAIYLPLVEHNPTLGIEGRVLDTVVASCNGYPYFVALWGSELYEAMRAQGTATADMAVYETAKAAVDDRRRTFYGRRYDEISALGLLGIAAGLADAFADTRTLDPDSVRKTIAYGRPDVAAELTVDQALEALVDLGYIWLPPGTESYETGIPSLMSYLRERVIDRPAVRGRPRPHPPTALRLAARNAGVAARVPSRAEALSQTPPSS